MGSVFPCQVRHIGNVFLWSSLPRTRQRERSGAAQASVMVAEGRDASIAVGQHWEETWAAVVEFALGPCFCHHFRSSFLFAAVELQDNQLGQVVQSPEVTWLCALGCDRRQRCRSRPRAALHVRVRQRLQILPPEKGVSWSGQKGKKRPRSLKGRQKCSAEACCGASEWEARDS